MKKLICAADVRQSYEKGTKKIGVDQKTIVTPSARDLADELGVIFDETACLQLTEESISKNQLVELLKQLLSGDVIQKQPYLADKHANGLKVVHGSSVRMDHLDTGNAANKVTSQEILSGNEAHLSAGFLDIDHCSFGWKLTYEEIDYVIEGTLQITIDGKTYTAKAGDMVFVPNGSDVTWQSPDRAKMFYATYPANY